MMDAPGFFVPAPILSAAAQQPAAAAPTTVVGAGAPREKAVGAAGKAGGGGGGGASVAGGKTGRWSEEEHALFLEGLALHGPGAWVKFAELIPTRSVVQIRTHAQKYFQKLRKSQEKSASGSSGNGGSSTTTGRSSAATATAAGKRNGALDKKHAPTSTFPASPSSSSVAASAAAAAAAAAAAVAVGSASSSTTTKTKRSAAAAAAAAAVAQAKPLARERTKRKHPGSSHLARGAGAGSRGKRRGHGSAHADGGRSDDFDYEDGGDNDENTDDTDDMTASVTRMRLDDSTRSGTSPLIMAAATAHGSPSSGSSLGLLTPMRANDEQAVSGLHTPLLNEGATTAEPLSDPSNSGSTELDGNAPVASPFYDVLTYMDESVVTVHPLAVSGRQRSASAHLPLHMANHDRESELMSPIQQHQRERHRWQQQQQQQQQQLQHHHRHHQRQRANTVGFVRTLLPTTRAPRLAVLQTTAQRSRPEQTFPRHTRFNEQQLCRPQQEQQSHKQQGQPSRNGLPPPPQQQQQQQQQQWQQWQQLQRQHGKPQGASNGQPGFSMFAEHNSQTGSMVGSDDSSSLTSSSDMGSGQSTADMQRSGSASSALVMEISSDSHISASSASSESEARMLPPAAPVLPPTLGELLAEPSRSTGVSFLSAAVAHADELPVATAAAPSAPASSSSASSASSFSSSVSSSSLPTHEAAAAILAPGEHHQRPTAPTASLVRGKAGFGLLATTDAVAGTDAAGSNSIAHGVGECPANANGSPRQFTKSPWDAESVRGQQPQRHVADTAPERPATSHRRFVAAPTDSTTAAAAAAAGSGSGAFDEWLDEHVLELDSVYF